MCKRKEHCNIIKPCVKGQGHKLAANLHHWYFDLSKIAIGAVKEQADMLFKQGQLMTWQGLLDISTIEV